MCFASNCMKYLAVNEELQVQIVLHAKEHHVSYQALVDKLKIRLPGWDEHREQVDTF